MQLRAVLKESFERRVLYLHLTIKGLSGRLEPGGSENGEGPGPSLISAQCGVDGAKGPVSPGTGPQQQRSNRLRTPRCGHVFFLML